VGWGVDLWECCLCSRQRRWVPEAPPCSNPHSHQPPIIPSTLSTVIKDFCKQVGVDNKQVQAVVRLAKKNGALSQEIG